MPRSGRMYGPSVFDQKDLTAMTMALEDACRILHVSDGETRERLARRVIELVNRGERSPTRLRDKLLEEAELVEYFR